MSTVHDLITASEADASRQELVERCSWFLHIGRFDRFDEYKRLGIQPRNPELLGAAAGGGGAGTPAPEPFRELLRMLGKNADEIICFRPIDTTFDSTPTHDGQKFRMAVSSANLPRIVTLDLRGDNQNERARSHPD